VEVKIMKASIDRDGCIACGLCTTVCPEVFRMADDGLAEVYVDVVPEEVEGKAVLCFYAQQEEIVS
jgi:ferredoxin